MNNRLFSTLFVAATPLALADAPVQQLTITVATPKVAIAPQIPGRQFLPLPALEYHFLLEPRCAAGWTPQSMTLSIADSRSVLAAESLDEHGFARLVVAVPAAQLAPLPVSGFCEAADGGSTASGDENAELRLTAAVSAHAALICRNADAERISYVSRPLGLTFKCAPQPGTMNDEVDALQPD